jgi:HEPN domain-containing protein
MEKEDLKQIANLIADKVQVEKIYCLNYADVDTHHLIILLPASNGKKFTELEPFVKMATNANKGISFTLYQTSEVRSALKSGNLFFHIACVDQNLLYNKENSPGLPLPKANELLVWKNEANVQFKDGVGKATPFLEGANFYSEKNEPGLTVFMLHQFIELTYRAIELAILAKEKKTHSISIHQSFIIPFIPQLGVLFPADTIEEKEILKTINNAYSAVRYEQNHKVNENFIATLFHRAYLLQKRSATIIDDLSALLDAKEAEALSFENDKTDVAVANLNLQLPGVCTNEQTGQFFNASRKLKEVIFLIIENIAPDQIYVFGNTIFQSVRSHLFNHGKNDEKNTLHYDLLAISSLSNPYSNNIQSIVNEVDGIRVNLYIHAKEEVIKKIENQNKFFVTVIGNGQIVYSKINLFNKVTISENCDEISRNQTIAYSTRRIFRATAILKAVELIKDDVFEVTLSLLAQSIEQACLGLIYNFLGYYPNLYSLPHLLNLCKIFWPDSEDFFPMQTPDDRRLLALLSQSYSELRYTIGKPLEPDDLNEVYARSYSFVIRSEKLYLDTLTEFEVEDYNAVS